MKKPLSLRIEESANSQQGIILGLLLVPDAIAIAFSAITAYTFRFQGAIAQSGEKPAIAQFEYRGILSLLVVAWIVTLVATGTYHFNHTTLVTFNLRMIFKRSFAFFFFIGFLSFILKASFSRSVFLIMLTSGLLYLFFSRIIIYSVILRPLIMGKKVSSNLMIIGHDKKEVSEHSDWLIKNRRLGFTIASRLVCSEITRAWIEEFDKLLQDKRITQILLLPGMEGDQNFSKFIHYCEDLDLHVNWIPLDSGNLGYWLIPSPQEGIPFLTFEKSEISWPWRIIKRGFDLLFSTLVILIFSPVLLTIAVAVLISSGWPILYSQKRIGLNGRVFKFYKFRSMIKGADQIVHEVENLHGADHVLFKNRQDPRVTPVGRVLRRNSLDELPQFFNVLNNSMSVVGPRPALPSEVGAYNSIYERRLIAKPGITGPWQISGRSDLDLRTSVALDLNYLINWSFTRDLWIIVLTVGAVLKGKGAY